MRLRPVYYIYPLNKWVSFRSIAEAHVRELRKYFYVQVYDEEAATIVIPIALCTSGPLFILHPYFYPMSRYEARLKAKAHGIIIMAEGGGDRGATSHMRHIPTNQ
jgi:hypothetical protein